MPFGKGLRELYQKGLRRSESERVCQVWKSNLISVNPLVVVSVKMFDILPSALICYIFGYWIDIKPFVRLDSAYCNKEYRLALVSILSCNAFTFCRPVPFSNPNLITWFYTREVKVSSIILGENSVDQPPSDYLRKWSSNIRCVDKRPVQSGSKMLLLSIHCKNLQVVRCKNLTLDSAFNQLLLCNPNIAEILLKNVFNWSSEMFKDVPMSKLSLLSISESICSSSSFNSFIRSSLQKLQLGSKVHENLIMNVVTLCAGLKALSLKDVQMSTAVLVKLCIVRPTLLHLDLSNNQLLDSDCILSITRSLKLLRSISWRNCANVSNRSIHNLALHCGRTLEVLHCGHLATILR